MMMPAPLKQQRFYVKGTITDVLITARENKVLDWGVWMMEGQEHWKK